MFELYKAGLAVQAVRVFRDLLEIGITHEGSLAKPPIQWAHDLTLELAKIYENRAKFWIRAVCDPPDFDTDLNWDDPDEAIMGKAWCAPLLIVMRPSRYMPFDETRQWKRADRETTKGWLNSFAEFFTILIKLHIDRLADEKTVELAKKPKPVDDLHRAFEVHQFDAPQTDTTEGRNRFSEQVGKSHSGFTWKELEIRFQEIQAKVLPRQSVYAVVTRTEWISGAVGEEWIVGGNLALQKEFEYLGSIAAQKLGYAPSNLVFKDWLGRVREWMQKTGLDKDQSFTWRPTGYVSDGGTVGTTQSLVSEKIAELSARFCMKLIALGTPESIDYQLPPMAQAERAPNAKPGRPPGRRKLKIMQAVFAALQARDEGPKYCETVDRYRPPVSQSWIEDVWPGSYAKAYTQPKWAKRIQDQKSKFRRIYDQMSNQQREQIIQGTASTRHSR